jgi:hypothetical protein
LLLRSDDVHVAVIVPSSLTARIITTNQRIARPSNDETFSGLRKSPETLRASKKTDTVINGANLSSCSYVVWKSVVDILFADASSCLAVKKFPMLIQGGLSLEPLDIQRKANEATVTTAAVHWTLKETYLVRNNTVFSNGNCDKMFGDVARVFKDYSFLEFKIKMKYNLMAWVVY